MSPLGRWGGDLPFVGLTEDLAEGGIIVVAPEGGQGQDDQVELPGLGSQYVTKGPGPSLRHPAPLAFEGSTADGTGNEDGGWWPSSSG